MAPSLCSANSRTAWTLPSVLASLTQMSSNFWKFSDRAACSRVRKGPTVS